MRRPEKRPTLLRQATRFAVALLGADLGLRLGSRTPLEIGPVIAQAKVSTGLRGGVDVHVPPIGDARLETHRGLLKVDATVTGVDEDQARGLLQGGGKIDVDLQHEIKGGLLALGRRSALSSVAGAALASALTERNAKQTVIGGLVGASAIAANAAIAYKTLRVDAWKAPVLSGLLARAPGVIGDVRQIPKQFGKYRNQLGEITASITGVYRGLTSLPGAPPKDAVRIVWLSDVHNNPLAFSIARSLVEQYDAAMVIDTGDIGDWGTTQESRAFADIKEIPAPYVFIKGNHDGPQTVAEIAKIPNVTVLDKGATTDQAGLLIVGDSDPRFTPDKSSGDDNFDKERLAQIGSEFAEQISGLRADIALIHDPVVATRLAGVVPLVLSGHTHKRNARRSGDTLLLTQGSSGGAGLRGVRQEPPDSLAISVLHIDPATKRLHTVDEFTFGGLGLTEVTLARNAAAQLGAPRVKDAAAS